MSPRVRVSRRLGATPGIRVVIDHIVYDLSEPDFLRLAQDCVRVLASIERERRLPRER